MSAIDRDTVDAALAAQLAQALAALDRLHKYLSPRLTLEEALEASGPMLLAKCLVQSVEAALTVPPDPRWMSRTISGDAALATVHRKLRVVKP